MNSVHQIIRFPTEIERYGRLLTEPKGLSIFAHTNHYLICRSHHRPSKKHVFNSTLVATYRPQITMQTETCVTVKVTKIAWCSSWPLAV